LDTNLHGKEIVWNVPVSSIQKEALVPSILAALQRNRKRMSVACVNPHSQIIAESDPSFKSSLESFDFLLPDGMGTVLASRFLEGHIKTRITGPDFFRMLSETLDTPGNTYNYYFLGSTPQVLQWIKENMALRYPNIPVAGTFSPPIGPFSIRDNSNMVTQINQVQPNILWVGLTAPKQEKWIISHLPRLDVQLAAAIGAEFDYLAGTKKRPPDWMRKVGLQWVHRFINEPKRTWRRHLVSMPLYVTKILLYRARHQKCNHHYPIIYTNDK
jgi:N-acetylglucosaminyldiphosphoundecaprenol N-acetyl-beta-D-mannosaminyltransferase